MKSQLPSRLLQSLTSSRAVSLACLSAALALFAGGVYVQTQAQTSDPPKADEKQHVKWGSDLSSALHDAEKLNKLVLLRFSADWCGPCQVMDIRVWPDSGVQAAMKGKFLPVKYDVDEEAGQNLGRKYSILGIPTLILLDGKGKEVSRSGFMSPPQLIQFLADAETAQSKS